MKWYEDLIVVGIVISIVSWSIKVEKRLDRLEKKNGLKDIDKKDGDET
jgi:hypothetical protein